jgi:hypothetical protein
VSDQVPNRRDPGELSDAEWQPIENMAAAQLAAGDDRAGAIAIFRAADQPGPRRDHLRRRCRALTGVDPTA